MKEPTQTHRRTVGLVWSLDFLFYSFLPPETNPLSFETIIHDKEERLTKMYWKMYCMKMKKVLPRVVCIQSNCYSFEKKIHDKSYLYPYIFFGIQVNLYIFLLESLFMLILMIYHSRLASSLQRHRVSLLSSLVSIKV